MTAEHPVPAECEVCAGSLRGLGSTTTALMPQADGLLVMETGCASGLVPKLQGRRWYYLRFFEHVRAFSLASMKWALQRSGFDPLRIKLQSHSASRFGHYGKRGILGLMANGIGLNKPSPDRDGPVFFPFFDHQLVVAEKPEK